MTLEELIEAIRTRQTKSRYGIGFASSYLKSIESCLIGGPCPANVFAKATPEGWVAALKEADSKLTYCSSGMKVKEISTKAKEEYAIPGSICEFECVITTNRKDRDGDVLEPQGAMPDEAMPLLWQHMPFEPIGRLARITSQTANRVTGIFGIADTELGRDAATLLKFGALRISHGFQPHEYEPLTKGGDGDDANILTGWHVTKYEILEASLVSVPSNKDAVILAHRSGKLHHPAVQKFAESVLAKAPRRSRPAVVRGVTFGSPSTCACGTKAGEAITPSGATIEITGIKPAAAPEAKAGRTLSKKNEQALSDACELMGEAMNHSECHKTVKALINTAHGHIRSVIDSANPATGEEVDDKSASLSVTLEEAIPSFEDALKTALAALAIANPQDIEACLQFKSDVARLVDRKHNEFDDEEWAKILADFTTK